VTRKGPENPQATSTLRLETAEDLRDQVYASLKMSTRPVLVVLSGNQMGRRVNVDHNLTIGRDPTSDLVLTDAGVSWRHGRLEDRGDDWVLIDLKSTNGTSVNGRGGHEFSLKSNDKLIFARTVVRFEVQDKTEQAYDELLERLLTIDDLSGLYVRRKFDEEVAAMLELAAREARTVGLLVMDLDGIKQINDTHGHLFGAYTIGESGRVIGEVIGSRGIGSRFGGDEFLAALPGLDKAESAEVAGEILRAINQHHYEREGIKLRPGISIGVAAYPADGATAEEIFQRGDEALYRAKQGGKNRVCL
jgi:diguanylate cyclase (GGDEF)-like protein